MDYTLQEVNIQLNSNHKKAEGLEEYVSGFISVEYEVRFQLEFRR